MSQTLDDFVGDIAAQLPEHVRDYHLLKAGLFPSTSALCKARARGDTPPYIRITAKQIFYFKSDVLAWLRSRYTPMNTEGEGSTKTN